ncbi:MAG TPA: DinB family protein [Acidobacteriaceae bacterium]|nr:DinB family protein [Acidobacteriaceae bacterium]
MDQTLQRTIAVLERTPAVLAALLRGLPEEWTRTNEGEGTWSAFDVVVHLINCEKTDWVPRARTILESKDGEVRELPPFDRWGGIRESQSKSMGEVLDDFARLRRENLATVREWNLSAEQMAMRGRHPALGEVTLAQLMATWAAHDLNHLHQISRVMARQYREAVGPWRKYMGVMVCEGHGA